MFELIQSNWINALFTLIINIGTSYVINDVQDIFHGIFAYRFMKWLVIFSICFATTKDISISLTISLLFSFLIWIVLENDAKLKVPKIKKSIKKYINNVILNKSDEY